MKTTTDLPKFVTSKAHWFAAQESSGPRQMALDVMLLEKSIQSTHPKPCLRFYTWKGPWLSLGHNQVSIPKHWKELAKADHLKIVKRPSGGGAVLHGSGLTYSIIWPTPPRHRQQAYAQTCSWLIKSFETLGLPLRFGEEPYLSINSNCFSAATQADLVDMDGQKRIGSAQFWRNGHLLQHGEILLDPPQKLWKEVFKCEAPPPVTTRIPRTGLDLHLQETMQSLLPGITWQEQAINKEELQRLNDLERHYTFD